MSDEIAEVGAIEFADPLPLAPVEAGTSVLVSGPVGEGARELSLATLKGGSNEGVIIVATDAPPGEVVSEAEALGVSIDRRRTGIVDCVAGGVDSTFPARALVVSDPGDLTAIGIHHSTLSEEIRGGHIERVRSGVVSLTPLLAHAEFKPVSRFVHTLAGRIEAFDGFGAFLVDSTVQEAPAIAALAGFCDGHVEVRRGDGGPELRCRDLAGQPGEWTPFGR